MKNEAHVEIKNGMENQQFSDVDNSKHQKNTMYFQMPKTMFLTIFPNKRCKGTCPCRP